MISVIIPTLNAETFIRPLIESLTLQTLQPDEIIVVDSESTDSTVKICQDYSNVRILSVLRKDFDHGKTRDMALRKSKGDIVVFMTQDAYPADKYFLENLIDFLNSDKQLAVVSGRQLAREDATITERLVREFNYPPKSNIRSKKDIPQYGIKTYYCTDVCAAYRREIYLKLGGFDYPLKTNEDMFFAAKAVNSGYKVGYAANAMVVHSHSFTLKQQYDRNYIQGYEIERHKKFLGNASANSEGLKMVKTVSLQLLKQGKIASFVHFGLDCFARMMGNKMGIKALQNEKEELINVKI